MANARVPGPVTGFQPGSEANVCVADGTLSLQASSRPGATDTSRPLAAGRPARDWRWVDRWHAAGAIWDAMGMARDRAMHRVWQELQIDLGECLKGVLWAVLISLGVLATGTALGAAIGGALGALAAGVGAAPGAVAGGVVGADLTMAALTWLGVGFLIVNIGTGLPEVGELAARGVERAAESVLMDGPLRHGALDQGADLLARAAVLMLTLILQGIVLWLLKSPTLAATRGAASSVGSAAAAARSGQTAAASQAAVAELVLQLRSSRVLPQSFATWVERHWAELLDNPKLQPATRLSAGTTARAAEVVTPSQLRAMRQAPPPEPVAPPRPAAAATRLPQRKVPCFHPYDKARFAQMGAEQQRDYLKDLAGQLKRQQEAINSMTAAEYKAARDAFDAIGRNPLADRAQAAFRDAFERDVSQSIRESLLQGGMGAAQAKAQAAQRAGQIMDSLAALHEPDMVAGGWMQPEPQAMGRSDINASIGGSWKQGARLETMDKAAVEAIQSGQGHVKMNVSLEPCRGKGMR